MASKRGKLDENDRNPDGTFKKGKKKTGGRQLGQRDFATDFEQAVKEIAKLNKITISEARITLLKVAYKNAKDGNYNFWRDIHDRIYGKPKESLDVTTGGDKLNPFTDDQLKRIAEGIVKK